MEGLFKQRVAAVDCALATFHRLETLQVNLGDICNLSCTHCHHNASPRGTRIMRRDVMDEIAGFLLNRPGLTLDITGGCPEINPDFRYFVEITDRLASRRIIRSNLAVLVQTEMEWLPDFYRTQQLVVMASLPCYEEENVDAQRGRGVYNDSIEALQRLNEYGYGDSLELHLVYNPGGNTVAGQQDVLERHYRRELLQRFGIRFNRLHCMNNAPLGRYEQHLKNTGRYQGYIDYLSQKFNPDAAAAIMCRTLISVGWDGRLYNCDFNLAADLPIRKGDSPITISRINDAIMSGAPIRMADHCFSCTAGHGSGCGGTFSEAEPVGASFCLQ